MTITTAQYYNCTISKLPRKTQLLCEEEYQEAPESLDAKKKLNEIHDDRAGLGLGLATAIADEEATDDTMTKAAAAAEDGTRKDIATEEGKDRGTGEGDRIPGKE